MTQPFITIEEMKDFVVNKVSGVNVYQFLNRLLATAQTKELVEKTDSIVFDKIFKLAELLADEAFGKHGVEKYSERQMLTIAFDKILREKLVEKRNWDKYIDTNELADNSFSVFLRDSGKILGEIYKEVDGYYVYQPDKANGCWESYAMRTIADMLDEMNKEWDEQVKKELQ